MPAFFFAYSEENVRQSTQKMAFYNLPLDLKVLILLNFLLFSSKVCQGMLEWPSGHIIWVRVVG